MDAVWWASLAVVDFGGLGLLHVKQVASPEKSWMSLRDTEAVRERVTAGAARRTFLEPLRAAVLPAVI
jgi:hypothetical protein